MIIGIPKETKGDETRISILPSGVESLVKDGHKVIIESTAGLASGNSDEDYINAGGEIASNTASVYENAELIFKVKEPTKEEYKYIRKGQIYLGYYQTQNRPELTKVLLDKGAVIFSYERIKDKHDKYPLLAPMSAISGEVAVILGAYHMFNTKDGNGILIGGYPAGVDPAKVAIFGAGNSGLGALGYAVGLGAKVTLLDRNTHKLEKVKESMPEVETLLVNEENIEKVLSETDLLINSIRYREESHLITRNMLKHMKVNSVIVNADGMENGAIETTRETTHDKPFYMLDGIKHISISNYPNAVTNTSTKAFANATIPYIIEIANKGWIKATRENIELKSGLTLAQGYLTFDQPAELFGLKYTSVDDTLDILEDKL